MSPWSLTLLLLIPNMQVPESVYHDAATGYSYVANIVGQGWTDDGVGFVTRLKPNGQVDVLKWRTGTPQSPLSAPKGMCTLNGSLYVADITKVHRFALDGDGSATLVVPGVERLNDIATDGKLVYASDTKLGKIVRISPDLEPVGSQPFVASANGITFHKSRMYGVSWDLHEVYELDPAGVKAPRAFGLASHFTGLDGIEVLDDGSFIVSDFLGNKVCLISADEKQVKTLVEVPSPADIAVDRKGMRLFVPEFQKDVVAVYSLKPQ